MTAKRVNVSIPSELFARLETARGDVSRSTFVKRALESALSESHGGVGKPGAVVPRDAVEPASASTRASDDVEAHKAVHRDFAKSVSRDAMERQRRLNEKKS